MPRSPRCSSATLTRPSSPPCRGWGHPHCRAVGRGRRRTRPVHQRRPPAAAAGLAPALVRQGPLPATTPLTGDRALKRVFYQSAFCAIPHDPTSKAFYDRKRAEGKRHHQALIALARRRINVLYAMLRDRQPYQPRPPKAWTSDEFVPSCGLCASPIASATIASSACRSVRVRKSEDTSV